MLLPGQWTTTWPRKPFHPRGDRQSYSQGEKSTNAMGKDHVQTEEEGLEDVAQVRHRKPHDFRYEQDG